MENGIQIEQINQDVIEPNHIGTRLQKLQRAFWLTSDINRILVRCQEKMELLKQICETAVETGHFRLAWIGVIEYPWQQTRMVATAGDTSGYLEHLITELQSAGAAYQAIPDIANNLTPQESEANGKIEVVHQFELRMGINSSVTLPLFVSGKVWGTLNLYAEESGFFDEEEIRLLNQLAGDIAIVIERLERDQKHRLVEETLIESEERFRVTFELAAVGIAHVSLEGNWLRVNRRLCDIVGYSHEELQQLSFQDITHPDDLESDLVFVHQLLASERQSYSMEKRYIHKEGKLVWVNLTVTLVRDEAGEPKYFISIVEDITGRKQAEEQIRFLARFPEENPNPVIRLRKDGLIIYANNSSKWLLDEWNSTSGKYAPDFWRNLVKNTLKSNIPQTYDYHYRQEVWSFWATPVKEQGYVSLYGSNITASIQFFQKKAELASIVESSEDAITSKTLDGIITSWNKGAENIYGYTAREIIGKPISILVPPGMENDEEAVLKKIRSGKYVRHFETKRRRKDGQLIDIALTVSPIRDQDGNILAASSISRDITERKKIEHELRKLYQAVEQSSSSIVLTDLEGNIEYVNRHFTQLTGYSTEEVIGKNPRVLKSGQTPPEVYRQLWETISKGGEWRGELLNRKKNGEQFWEFASITGIRDSVGNLISYLAVKENITDRKKADEELAASKEELRIANSLLEIRVRERTSDLENATTALQQALAKEKELGELKTRFVSMASHEFRTPLATILATAESLHSYRQRMSDEQIEQRTQKIRDQIIHLKGIIDDVLQLTKIQARRIDFNPEMLDLDLLCREIIDEFSNRPDIKHELMYSANETGKLTGLDKKLMRQVITNLASNAIKYSPAEKPVKLRLRYNAHGVTLTITDQGIGIPTSDQERLFEPFHRGSNVGTISGTGLGMVITKESIELHGGTLRVESHVGLGTTFIVKLPSN